MSDLQYNAEFFLHKSAREALAEANALESKLIQAGLIKQQVKDGTHINTVEPRKMGAVEKLVRDCKMVEVKAVIKKYRRKNELENN